jgi:lipoprotein-anchoring transpeptidase ErfK/SrfK
LLRGEFFEMIVRYLSIIAVMIAALFAAPQAAEAKIHHYLFGTYDDGIYPAVKKVYQKKHRIHAHVKIKAKQHATKQRATKQYASKKIIKKKVALKINRFAKPMLEVVTVVKPGYQGRQEVEFASKEKPGTIIINTKERSLYEVLGSGKAMRYMVAVGKEGFEWTGVARVALKKVDPMWTPPPEMIERKPELAKWAMGMPGGDPQNPLGPRALYLFKGKRDTGFRIHGTIYPESIGTAASSGCIRMLNAEVIELFQQTRVGTKVIVL